MFASHRRQLFLENKYSDIETILTIRVLLLRLIDIYTESV